ncbi:SusC/RagA family TonB-linked outer membrane protein [Flavivirga rizhaonensis]|nr:SusC/RagA family TonB-linked outer membrane protein [Flavivirga rizhaonensis]
MRTFVFLFCTIVFSLNPKTGFSQNEKITIDVDKTISLEEVFKLINAQTDYLFVYDVEMVKDAPSIALKRGKIKSNLLLKRALNPIGCTYEFANNTVVVKRKDTRVLDAYQKNTFTVTGTVSDALGNPIAGASVYVSSDSNSSDSDFLIRGTQTDFDGRFKIEVSKGLILHASFIGFEEFSQKITSEQQKEYNITLKENINKLDEVVLTGYTSTNQEQSTAASSKITKKDINRQKAINLIDRLEGLSPGLNLNSVTNGGGQRQFELVLRGISTFDIADSRSGQIQSQNSLNRQPLIVLDGFPYEGPLNDIDPQTIETIDVLRDAAATTLWGIRASNGVLVITTKRGFKYAVKPTITFSSNITIGTKQDLSGLGLANAEETIKIYNNEYELNSFFNTATNVFSSPNPFNRNRTFALLDPFEQIWADFYNPNGGISEAERDARLAQLGERNVLDDFEKYLLSPGFIRENSLSIRGGSTDASYSFTATHVDEDRPDLGDEFRRLNLSLTTDIKLNRKVSVVIDASITNSETNDNGIGVASLLSSGGSSIKIYDQLVDSSGNTINTRNLYPQFQDEFIALGFDDPSYNPVLDQSIRDNETKSFNLRLAAGINYKVTDWLTADLKYQYNSVTDKINNNKDVSLFETRINNNNYVLSAIENGNNTVTRALPYGGTLENSVTNNINSIIRGSLKFHKTFAEKHSVAALAGMEVSENTFDLSRRTYYGYNDRTGLSAISSDLVFGPTDFYYLRPFSTISNNNAFQPEVKSRAISSFGNVSYSYDSKYNISLSGKIDQTTAFGINKRLSKPLLWAAGGSWNITNEQFFKVNWVNNLKLRGSYGVNGNLRRGLSTAVIIAFRNNNFINNQNYANISSSGNPNLTFEETITKNIGLDFGLFDSRIQGTLDVYDRLSENLLSPFNINPTFGQSGAIFRNEGSISNKGVELSLNLDILRDTPLKWNANFNISYNKNKVLSFVSNDEGNPTDLIEDVGRFGTQQIIGEDISAEYRYQWAGLDDQGNPQVLNENGDVIGYQEDYPSIDALVKTKPFIAPGFGGFRNTFEYKNFSLSFLASFKFGHVFQESLLQKYPNKTGIFHKDVANAWEAPGDELTTNIPALPRDFDERGFKREEFFTLSNYNIQDAAFVRLRDITLGYSLNSDVIKRVGLNAVNFTLQARNLGLIWKANDVDVDPESIPFSTSEFSDTDDFQGAFRPGIQIPVTVVLGVNLNF